MFVSGVFSPVCFELSVPVQVTVWKLTRLRNDHCVEWDVKLYSLTNLLTAWWPLWLYDHDLVQCWRGLAAPSSMLFVALEETMNMFNKKQLHLYHVYALSLSAKHWHLVWDDMNEEATYSPVQTNLTLHSKIS